MLMAWHKLYLFSHSKYNSGHPQIQEEVKGGAYKLNSVVTQCETDVQPHTHPVTNIKHFDSISWHAITQIFEIISNHSAPN